MTQSKVVQITFLISTIVIGWVYGMKLKDDLSFYFTKRVALATLRSVTTDQIGRYSLEISYFNQDRNAEPTCMFIFEESEGNRIVELIAWEFLIYYSKNSSCNIYFKGHEYRTIGTFLIHYFLFSLSLFGIFLFIRYIKVFYAHQNKKIKAA